ncbi:MAG: cytochrome b [Gammaproteobacteria bacterium]|nr:cytochrome b [Gammaproteobacteria bacterium]
MPLKNSATHYGAVTRFLHWSVFMLFIWQYLSAAIMTHLAKDQTLLHLTQGDYYHWHKSIGLVLLALALARWIWRKTTPLPDWAPALSPAERTFSHWNEVRLYGCMFLLPISGYLFVMAGGFGVKLFGFYDLPNPIGKQGGLATIMMVTHIVLGYAAVVFIAWHTSIALKHHWFEQDGFLNRMLPFRRP